MIDFRAVQGGEFMDGSPVMSGVLRVCRKCGAEIFADASEGLCTACLLETGLDLLAPSPAADPLAKDFGAGDDCGSVENVEASAAPHTKKAPRPAKTLADFGDYQLLEEIGRGGQGVVYRAHQKSLNRTVALKVIGLGHWATEAHLKRFRLEAEAAASLEHPGIVPIHEVGERDGSCYFSMKFIDGGQLDAVAKREPMPIRHAAELIAKLARTVSYAHEHGILHRDIKPGNVLLDAKGEPHLTDFGLARLVETESTVTRTMEVLGTPSYMAPEQAVGNNARVAGATDIYGLGAVLYQLLTGHPPFAGGTTFETVRLVLDTEPRKPRLLNPKVDRDLATICLKCLEKDPKRRYASALALAEDLEHWLKHEPILAHRTGIFTRGKKWVRRNPTIALLILSLAALAAAVSWNVWKSEFVPSPAATGIAVLPFENRSEEKANAYLADGIQDEILTRLSKIADLKVIARTSTQHYKSAPKNLPEIAKQLGVAHILEGSVQKSGDAVRVNVQLIRAANGSHLWADTFDRKLTDIFSVESEVAKAIADQLQAHLSGHEEQVIAAKPTDNPEAYDAYLRGLAYTLKTLQTTGDALAAQKYLREAVRLDPKFALGWALLSFVDTVSYRTVLQPSVVLREEARRAAETALTLQPNLGEALHATGFYHYSCLRDYDTAVRYFEQARQLLPNSSRVLESLALLERRRGQYDRSESYFNEAERLDPRNVQLLTQHAGTYMNLRRFPEALRKLDQVLDIAPGDVGALAVKGLIAQAEGDLLHASALLAPIHPGAADLSVLEIQVYQAILERRPAQIIPRLKEVLAKPDPALGYYNGELRIWLSWAQEVAGDHAAAQESWRQARSELEPFLKEQQESYFLIGGLALTNMGLGDKAAALALSERAIAANPIEKDAIDGPASIEILARVATQMGEPDRAIAALQKLLSIPYGGALVPVPLTPALLRLDPMFDPLRNDPRFQKLVATGIAVLPFENRSEDKANAYLADGIQDEILTDLATVADLKVISRTSVMPYKSGMPRNVREIGQQLGVAHVVEGSVQRSGNRVRVNAQLVDARTDRHLWAQTYDRDLADVFAIQSEIAKTIADQLQARLSPSEKNAIQLPPTNDISAFDLYTRAKNILLRTGSIPKADTLQAVDLLTQAVARDPSFFDAYCQLAYAHDALYFFGEDHTSARLALAEAALQAASRLRPDAGETHLARGLNLYWAYGDYDGALAELAAASQTLPNDARIFELTGLIQRRQGRWEESTRNLERAVELNPRDIGTLVLGVASNYWFLRRYAEAKPWLARALAFEPNNAFTKVWLAYVDFTWKADTRPLHQTIDSIRATNPAAVPSIAGFWLVCALGERDAAAAKDALIGFGEESISFAVENVRFNRPFAEGVIARMTKDDEKARSAFTAARTEQEKIVQAQPNYGPTLCVLGLIDAALGRKEEALREGRRAVELLPLEKDSMNGTNMVRYLAIIAAWAGDKDLACEQLASIIRRPSNVSYGQLKLLPFWDPLRGDPRFEKLVEESKQPVALK
jgi:TolB-like protein/Tfp pilus assembly protein PilF